MDDAGAMDGVETQERVDGDGRGVARRERPARLDQLVQVAALDVLPDHVERAVVERGEVVQRGDVRMLDLRGQPRLAEEAVVRAGIGGDVRAHQLDHADGVQMDVEDLVDLPHPPHPEPRQNLVFPVDGRFEVTAQKISDRLTAVGAGFELRIDLRSAVNAGKGHDLDGLSHNYMG